MCESQQVFTPVMKTRTIIFLLDKSRTFFFLLAFGNFLFLGGGSPLCGALAASSTLGCLISCGGVTGCISHVDIMECVHH